MGKLEHPPHTPTPLARSQVGKLGVTPLTALVEHSVFRTKTRASTPAGAAALAAVLVGVAAVTISDGARGRTGTATAGRDVTFTGAAVLLISMICSGGQQIACRVLQVSGGAFAAGGFRRGGALRSRLATAFGRVS